MTARSLPSARDLSRAQYSGWACVWCDCSLLRCGGTSVGRAEGSIGDHDMSVEVYACPACIQLRAESEATR